MRKIGFDIGDVMCPDLPKRRNPDGTYRLVQPFEGCLETLEQIALKYGSGNLFVISRAFDRVSADANWSLLRSWSFFERTGISEKNICIYQDADGDRGIKGRVSMEFGLTDFVDDKREILDLMPRSVKGLYLFAGPRTTADDIIRPPRAGTKLVLVQNWLELAEKMA